MKGTITRVAVAVLLAGALVGGFAGRTPAPHAVAAPVPKGSRPLVAWSVPLDAPDRRCVPAAAWMPDGEAVVAAGPTVGDDRPARPGVVRIRSAATGETTREYEGSDDYRGYLCVMAVSPDGKRVAATVQQDVLTNRDTRIDLFDVESGARDTFEVQGVVPGMAFAPDGRSLAVVDLQHNRLEAWDPDARTRRWVSQLEWRNYFDVIPWAGGREWLVTDSHREVTRVEAATGTVLPPLGRCAAAARCLSASSDERRVAAGGWSGLTVLDGGTRAWSIDFGATVDVEQVSLSPDGRHVAAACSDGTVKVYDADTGGLLAVGREHTSPVFRVRFSPEGRRLLTVGQDAIKVWDVTELLKTGDERGGATPDARRKNAPVPKEGKDDGLIWLHNTKTSTLTAYTADGKEEKKLTLKDGPHLLGITPDGTKIAFAGKKGKLAAAGDAEGLSLHVREVNDKTEGTDTGLSLKPGDAAYWSPGGTQVVRLRSGEPDKAGDFTYEHVLFDLATKKETKVDLPVNLYMRGWSPDGKAWHLHEYVRADRRNPNLPRYRMMSVPAGGGM